IIESKDVAKVHRFSFTGKSSGVSGNLDVHIWDAEETTEVLRFFTDASNDAPRDRAQLGDFDAQAIPLASLFPGSDDAPIHEHDRSDPALRTINSRTVLQRREMFPLPVTEEI